MNYQQQITFKGEIIQGTIQSNGVHFRIQLASKPPSSPITLTKEQFNQLLEELTNIARQW